MVAYFVDPPYSQEVENHGLCSTGCESSSMPWEVMKGLLHYAANHVNLPSQGLKKLIFMILYWKSTLLPRKAFARKRDGFEKKHHPECEELEFLEDACKMQKKSQSYLASAQNLMGMIGGTIK